jgi:predicted RNA methylase
VRPEEFNDVFYPTPPGLAAKMVAKIKGHPETILEPSAGKGDLIKAVKEKYRYSYRTEVSAIEIDQHLRAILRGNDVKVIDSDFLDFAGPDKFDLIIANPPFNEGAKHLMKAIDIMYRGQIIFLLNAATVKNTCNRARQELAKKLEELGAEVEYLQGEFEVAERKTSVEVALVNIVIERDIADDLFEGVDEKDVDCAVKVEDKFEVATGKTIFDMVNEYNELVRLSSETIIGYFRNHRKIGKYIGLNREPEKATYSSEDLTARVQNEVNRTVARIRKDFWGRALELKEVKGRLTLARLKEFEGEIESRKNMAFTENNVRNFILNVIGSYNDTLTKAVLEVFDKMTVRHCYDDGLRNENIHLYNGWKTNKAYRVGKKVVLPIYAGYGEGPFRNFDRWDLHYDAARILEDFDVVMSYFDGRTGGYFELSRAIKVAFQLGQTSGIKSTYFTATCYKKGTIHLTFNDQDILRRFNVAASLGKGWLPPGFGEKHFHEMDDAEKAVVDSFEGEKEYSKHVGEKVYLKAAEAMPLLMAA